MRNIPKRQAVGEEDAHVNYKELYLECKKNVGIFMKQVDKEMSEILKKHESEKKGLEAEISRLKGEIQQQKQNSALHYTRATHVPSSHKRSNSESYVHTQTSVTSVSKEAVQECLSKFNFDERPKNNSLRKTTQQESRLQTTMKSIIEQQKENQIPSANLNDIDFGQLKGINSSMRRDKRLKEKRIPQSGEKVESIKDFLKDIRGKLSSRQKTSAMKERDEPIISVITPELFSSHRAKNN